MKCFTLCFAAVLLTGCATNWDKPGASSAEFARDNYECQREAAQTYPVTMMQNTYGTGYQAPARTNCQTYAGQTNCATTPGAYTPPAQSSQDVNAIARAMAVPSCLRGRGYTPSRG